MAKQGEATAIAWERLETMKQLLLLTLLLTCGCANRYTENDVARWHGYQESERVPSAELGRVPVTRCYQGKHDESPKCFWISEEGRGNFEIK